jgi:uncharacterized protein YbaP (TraB family)
MLRGLIFGLSLLAFPALAECTGPSLIDRLTSAERSELDAVVAGMPFAEGILWQAERDGRVVTIAGTMHIEDGRLGPIFESLRPHLAASDLLMLEMTPAEQSRMQEVIGDDPSIMFLTDGPTLPAMLDEGTWDALSQAASDRNIPPLLAAKFRPWFLMLSLSMPVCALGYLDQPGQGLDQMLMEAATTEGVPMLALEPWDTIFTLFERGSIEEQLDFLRMGMLDADLQEEMFVAMLDGYFEGNIAEVWELSRLSLRFIPDISRSDAEALFNMTEAALLSERNEAWIPVIEAAALDHDRIMVAAGAAHLPGDKGILALLEARGWTITALDQP